MRMRISFLPKRSESSFEIDRPMVVGCCCVVVECKRVVVECEEEEREGKARTRD